MRWLLALASLSMALAGPVSADVPAPTPTEAKAPPPADATVPPPELPLRIDDVVIHGVKRTKREVILRELGVRPGGTLTPDRWRLGIARLWNSNLFSNVHAHIERLDGRDLLVLDLDERWSLNPLFSFGSGGSARWWRIGVTEFNAFGQFLEFNAIYERFDQYNGFSLQFREPRLMGGQRQLYVAAERLMRPRPGFVDRRLHARFDINQLMFMDKLRLGAAVDVFQSDFLPPAEGATHLPAKTNGLGLDLGVRFGRIDQLRNRARGWSVELRPMVVAVAAEPSVYAQLSLEGLAFVSPGAHWTFAARVQAGTMSLAPVSQRWFLGGLQQVRGFHDNYLRTRNFALINGEVRVVVFDSWLLAVVPALFVDAAAARDDAMGPTWIAALGGGVRFLVPAFVRTGLRVDVAAPVKGTACRGARCLGLSIGIFQFFF